ncbi:MAG: hypothetical protein WBY71_09535 [Nitrososphaeraceae archaeon]
MKNIEQKLVYFDRQTVTGEMNEKGYALVSRFLPGQSCDELIRKYNNSDLYHKTSTMERHRFGLGGYKQVTITEIIWQNGKALEILRIEIKSAEHSSSIMNLLSWVSF